MIVPAIGFERRLPEAVLQRLRVQGVSEQQFAPWLRAITRETAQRELDGERDHLIHYALQSRKFTNLPAIEPALSAKTFIETGFIPPRIDAFRTALQGAGGGERMAEFRKISKGADLDQEYRRAMRFLYSKEFASNKSYAKRGHSTDTAFAANYAVWTGLNVLKGMRSDPQIRRVLIIGPGLDFAPRTALIEEARPQSYQPFAVLDMLPQAEIHCYDINERVIRFISTFAGHPVLEVPRGEGAKGYQTYFAAMGRHLGRVTRGARSVSINVNPSVVRRITAEKHNLLTDEPKGAYDLVIATNVLLYYEGPELTLALANIAAHMKPGGYFLHNDLRVELDAAAQAAGLEAVAARTVQISATTFDSFALYTR